MLLSGASSVEAGSFEASLLAVISFDAVLAAVGLSVVVGFEGFAFESRPGFVVFAAEVLEVAGSELG